MPGRIHGISKAQIQNQVGANLEIILDVPGVIVGRPAWLYVDEGQRFLVRSAKEKTGKRIPAVVTVRDVCGLETGKIISGRSVREADARELDRAPLETEANRVAPFSPRDTICHHKAVRYVVIIVGSAEIPVANIDGTRLKVVERNLRKYLTTSTRDAQRGVPILACNALSFTEICEPVEPHNKVV